MKRNVRSPLRLAALVLIVGVVLGLLAPRLFASGTDSRSGIQTIHVVSNGETLWAIAARYNKGRDPRAFVQEINALNGLAGPQIFPGQKLVIPPA